jgi:hypothetical protein
LEFAGEPTINSFAGVDGCMLDGKGVKTEDKDKDVNKIDNWGGA